MVDSGSDMINPNLSAHILTHDAWEVRISAISEVIMSEAMSEVILKSEYESVKSSVYELKSLANFGVCGHEEA